MEEISPLHNFKIYIENVFCDPTEDVSCPRSIIVSYRSHVITLINHNLIGTAQLEVKLYIFHLLNVIVFYASMSTISHFYIYISYGAFILL